LGIAGEDAVGVGVEVGAGVGVGVTAVGGADAGDEDPPPPQLDRTITKGKAQPRTASFFTCRP
jgi:hypothetical protein